VYQHGFLAARYLRRALRQRDLPARFALISRGADGEPSVTTVGAAATPAPTIDVCLEAVARAEAAGSDSVTGVMFEGERVYVFTPPSLGQVVLVCGFNDDAELVELQVGQQGEPRDVDELTNAFQDGLQNDAEGDATAVRALGECVGLALAQALLAVRDGQPPFAHAYGTPIVRKRGETTFTMPVMPDEEPQTLSRWLTTEQPDQFALLAMRQPGLITITVQPHDFQCGYAVAIEGGVVKTSPPRHRRGERYDGTADAFMEGVVAGIAQHSAAAELAPGLGTLPFDG